MSHWLRRIRSADPWTQATAAVLAAYGLALLLLFQDYGITVDEGNRIAKGSALIRWYTTWFHDPTLGWRNLWLYGGAYDTPVALLTRILPFDLYDVRHLCNAGVGLLGVVGAVCLGRLLGGPAAGLLAALFLILAPRYFGHAFNNPKDIPFAVAYLWSLYLLAAYVPRQPRLSAGGLLKLGVVIGLAMGIRVNAAVLLAYVLLFMGIRHLQVVSGFNASSIGGLAGRFLVVVGSAWAVMLLFWPWAQLSPLLNPLRAITAFSHFGHIHANLFEGSYVESSHVPWYYGLKWIALTSPEHVLLGLLLLPVAWRHSRLDTTGLQRAVLLLGALFPLAYAALKGAALYNGVRHLLFAVAPLIVASGIGVADLARTWARRRPYVLAPMALLLGLALFETVTLHPHQVVYFNRVVAGGLAGAQGLYDLDYYGNSYRRGVQWAQDNLHAQGRRLRLAADTGYLKELIDPATATVVGDPWKADAYLVTNFQERWRAVPGRRLHTVSAQGVPLLFIVRPDDALADEDRFKSPPFAFFHRHKARILQQRGRPVDALGELEAAVALDPSPDVRLQLARLAATQGQVDRAVAHLTEAIRIDSQHPESLAFLGTIYAQQARNEEATRLFERALRTRPYYVRPLRSLTRTYVRLGRRDEAEALFLRLARMEPTIAYEEYRELGTDLREAGAHEHAVWAFQHALQLEVDTDVMTTRLYLARSLGDAGQRQEAIDTYEQILAENPGLGVGHYRLGMLLVQQQREPEALSHLRSAARLDTSHSVLFVALGLLEEKTGNTVPAAAAFRRALRLNPDSEAAGAGLQRTGGSESAPTAP